ncbi:MAG: murein hydrolase activator EnvC family protein [Bacteroidales bacterium]
MHLKSKIRLFHLDSYLLKAGLRFLILFLIMVLTVPGLFAQAQKQIKDLEKKRKAALAQIEITGELLNSTKKDAASTLERMQLLSRQIEVRKNYIQALNKEIGTLDRQIGRTTQDIKDLQFELSMKKQNYAKAMQGMSKRKSSYDKLMFIFSGENFAQTYRRVRYLREYAVWRRIQSEEIMEKAQKLEAKRQELEKSRASKNLLLAEREGERKAIEQEEVKSKELSAELGKKRKELEGQLKKQHQQADALNRKIEQIIEEEARKAAEEAKRRAAAEAKRKAAEAAKRKAAEAAKRKANASAKEKEKVVVQTPVEEPKTEERVSESKGGYAMTSREQKLSSSFGANRGRLPMPLRGKYVIVGRFGVQQHKDHKFVKTENKGIDILTTTGTDARSVFEGEISRVFVVPGFNNTVIVRHGNYLSVYSNLSRVYVKAGDRVNTGQSLGTIFSDPDQNNRSVLHFQIWKETTKLNPELWLNK